MALSYKGLLFRRIVVSSGYTYGKQLRVSGDLLQIKYNLDYDDHLRIIYKRNKRGYWEGTYETFIFNKQVYIKALEWLEAEGYIKVSWHEPVRVSRNYTGHDNLIRLTDKGHAAAPAYLRMKDPFPSRHFGLTSYDGVDLANEF